LYSSTLTNSDYTQLRDEGVNVGAGLDVVVGKDAGASIDGVGTSKTNAFKQLISKTITTSVVCAGGKVCPKMVAWGDTFAFDKDFQDWVKSITDEPLPIAFTLAPITDLLDKTKYAWGDTDPFIQQKLEALRQFLKTEYCTLYPSGVCPPVGHYGNPNDGWPCSPGDVIVNTSASSSFCAPPYPHSPETCPPAPNGTTALPGVASYNSRTLCAVYCTMPHVDVTPLEWSPRSIRGAATCYDDCVPKAARKKKSCCTGKGHFSLDCPKPYHFRCPHSPSPPPPPPPAHGSCMPDATCQRYMSSILGICTYNA
jgi:hypothetical protein